MPRISWQRNSEFLGLLTFFSILGLGNPENTVCKFSFGWGRGALNLRTSSSPKSWTTSSGWTPAGRMKRHTNELVNELLALVNFSRLPSTTTTFFSKVISRSSGWNLATLMDHWIRNGFIISIFTIFPLSRRLPNSSFSYRLPFFRLWISLWLECLFKSLLCHFETYSLILPILWQC